MTREQFNEPPVRYSAIKAWPADERPREKLISRGASALSDSELLAILINNGTQHLSAVDVAKNLLSEHRSLRNIGALTVADLKQKRNKGIGTAKAVMISAAFELARRISAKSTENDSPIRSPRGCRPPVRSAVTGPETGSVHGSQPQQREQDHP
jgi:DNA repair protein RadC